MTSRTVSRFICLLLVTGAAVAQAPSFKAYGNLNQVMRGIVLPNSDALFNVARQAPKDDKAWAAIENSAVALAEAGNLILIRGRLRENGQLAPVQRADWIRYTREMVEAGKACYKAARSKSQDAVTDATNQLVDSCDNCHKVYRGTGAAARKSGEHRVAVPASAWSAAQR